MLGIRDDTIRKVYTVLFHSHRYEWFGLDIKLTAQRSMRSEQQVKDSVNWLVREGYLKWDKERNLFMVPFK